MNHSHCSSSKIELWFVGFVKFDSKTFIIYRNSQVRKKSFASYIWVDIRTVVDDVRVNVFVCVCVTLELLMSHYCLQPAMNLIQRMALSANM